MLPIQYRALVSPGHQVLVLNPNMPIIIICPGFSHALTPGKAQQLGMPRLLHKPLFIQDLEAALEDVLPQKV